MDKTVSGELSGQFKTRHDHRRRWKITTSKITVSSRQQPCLVKNKNVQSVRNVLLSVLCFLDIKQHPLDDSKVECTMESNTDRNLESSALPELTEATTSIPAGRSSEAAEENRELPTLTDVHYIILDCSTMSYVDSMGVKVLQQVSQDRVKWMEIELNGWKKITVRQIRDVEVDWL